MLLTHSTILTFAGLALLLSYVADYYNSYLCVYFQPNKFSEADRDEAGDPHSHLAMQRKTSMERLHGNGDMHHSGWNERVAG